MLGRHKLKYRTVSRQMAPTADMQTEKILEQAKATGVEDMDFHKICGMKTEEMTNSKRVYRRRRNFRAGIEANVSRLNRVYWYTRCNWRGIEHFHA